MMNFRIRTAIFSVALALVACSKPDDGGKSSSGAYQQTFTAYAEQFASADEGVDVKWGKGDIISIFVQDKNLRFSLTETSEDGRQADFEGRGYDAKSYYAIYPYAVSNYIKSGSLGFELKDTQSAKADGFDPKAQISVAVSEDENLHFINMTAMVALTVGNDNVRGISLRSKDSGASLAGTAQVSFAGESPVLEVVGGKSSVKLAGTIRKGSRYCFSVLPGEFKSLEVVFHYSNSNGVHEIGSQLSLQRNTVSDLGVIEIEEPEAVSQWAALADSCNFVFVENFMNKNKGTFYGSPKNVSNNSSNLYWQQAHAIDVIVYAYERHKDTNAALAATYLSYIKKWYDNDANNYNNSKDSEGDYGGFFNAYTDDMCWICLTLLHMTEATGDEKYAVTAMNVFDKYIMPRAIAKENGTYGLPWTNIQDKMGTNACTNAPGCLVAAKLYRKYGKQEHLDNAMTLYTHCSTNLLKPDGRIEEPPLTYTQGTFGEACRQLYHITGEDSYMDLAGKVIEYAFTSGRCTNNGILRGEGQSNDQSLFKAVLIPYAVNYVLDEKADNATRETVKSKLLFNAETLRKNLDHSRYPEMYANYYWGTPFSEGVLNMGAQASGSSLIENVTRMDMKLKQ